jgi:hypothetical protein
MNVDGTIPLHASRSTSLLSDVITEAFTAYSSETFSCYFGRILRGNVSTDTRVNSFYFISHFIIYLIHIIGHIQSKTLPHINSMPHQRQLTSVLLTVVI